MAALLEVEKLTVIHQGDRGARRVLEDVDFRLGDGDTLGLVGESGSGKSVLLSAITGLLSPPWRIIAGHVRFRAASWWASRRQSSEGSAGVSSAWRSPTRAGT